MATGSVSALDPNSWSLIETKTISSSTSSFTFSSLGGKYKKLLLALNCGLTGNNGYFTMTFNNDTDANYAGGPDTGDGSGSSNREKNKIWLTATPTYDYQMNGYIQWANCDSVVPKVVEGGVSNYACDVSNGVYLGTSVVSSLEVQVLTVSANSGTVKLYGIVA
jgi:hypothetical protein